MTCKFRKPALISLAVLILAASLFTSAIPVSAQDVQHESATAGGFNSQFNGSMAGWATLGTVLVDHNSKYLYTHGLAGYWAQAYYKNATFSDFTYTVLMKRLYDQQQPNCVYVRMGTSLYKSTNLWYPGYAFCYRNYGWYGVFKRTSSTGLTPLQNWTKTDAIAIMGWNTLKVVAKGTTLKFYINGKLLKTVTDSFRSRGYVGIGMYDKGTPRDQLRVDWATLTLP